MKSVKKLGWGLLVAALLVGGQAYAGGGHHSGKHDSKHHSKHDSGKHSDKHSKGKGHDKHHDSHKHHSGCGHKTVSVPEPSTLILLGAGVVAIGLSRRKRSES